MEGIGMNPTDPHHPGHVPALCPGCVHHDPSLANQGHPNPCGMVRWIGPKHHKPSLERDASGVPACSDFQPQPSEATA
jgi:hypothetical protein